MFSCEDDILKKLTILLLRLSSTFIWFKKMESEIQRETIAQIISFTGYADIVYICIGATTDDQRFLPIILTIAEKYRLVIKIVLIDANVGKSYIDKYNIMITNLHHLSDIFVFTCKSTIYYHDFSFGFNSSNSDELFLSLLFQLKRKKKVHLNKTNLLIIQDFTDFYGLENLKNCIINDPAFKKILNNIIIEFYDINMSLDDYPLLYIIGSRIEVFLPETISDAEITFYFTSANNNRRLHYHMLDQVQKRIAITHRYFIPEWLGVFTFLSKLNKNKPSSKNFFMQGCQIDLQMIDNNLYCRRMMNSITMFLIIKIRARLRFLSSLGSMDIIMCDFYRFCKMVITNPCLSCDVRDKMIICCNNIVRKLWRTNIFTMRLTELAFPAMIQKIMNEFVWIDH